jgi:predicted KAP-like P-loop ATPase
MKYGDNPICTTAEDLLNRQASVEALATLLHDDALDTPMVVGIQGDWGSGKTSVMQLLMEQLQPAGLCIWFDAWRYGTERLAIWRGLVTTLVESVSQALEKNCIRTEVREKLTNLTDRLYRSLT